MLINRFHGLLDSTFKRGLLQELNLSPRDENTLASARDEIKDAVIAGFKNARKQARERGQGFDVPVPRFAMQGSRVYHTLNSPAYPPKQQVDIDLGVYLPFSALGNGERPKQATQQYFELMEAILADHLKQRPNNHWAMDASKDTCLRIQVSDRLHIDLPLYAAPESEMDRVRDAVEVNKSFHDSATTLDESSFDFQARFIEAVDPTVIHMAHRKKGWLPSDALVIRNWVKASCRAKGMNNAIRPVCRFLKAWRDERWRDGGGPSSIFLLAFTIENYVHVSGKFCDLLEQVIDRLPHAYDRPLLVPCPTSEDLDAREDLRDRVDFTTRQEYTQAFLSLKSSYQTARTTTSSLACNQILLTLFGPRLPMDTERVKQEPRTPSKAERAVRAAKPRVEPLFATPSSTTG